MVTLWVNTDFQWKLPACLTSISVSMGNVWLEPVSVTSAWTVKMAVTSHQMSVVSTRAPQIGNLHKTMYQEFTIFWKSIFQCGAFLNSICVLFWICTILKVDISLRHYSLHPAENFQCNWLNFLFIACVSYTLWLFNQRWIHLGHTYLTHGQLSKREDQP